MFYIVEPAVNFVKMSGDEPGAHHRSSSESANISITNKCSATFINLTKWFTQLTSLVPVIFFNLKG